MHTLREINLNLLVVLHELLVEGSVTRTAKKLAMSQSAVSHSLARLRDLIGDALFIQTKTGIKPTTKALELREPLEKTLHHANIVVNGVDAWEPATMKRTFRIALSDYGAYLLLPILLAKITKEAPEVDLICTQSEHQQIAIQLADRSIDFGCCIADTMYKNLCVTPLFTENLVCLVRKGSAFDGVKKLTLKSYVSLPHMAVSSTGNAYSEIDTILAQKGLCRRVILVSPHYTVAARVALESDMFLTLPYNLAARLPEREHFHFLTPPIPTKDFTYSMIWHPRSQDDAGHRWLREAISSLGEAVTKH